jgi:hypothetical protein
MFHTVTANQPLRVIMVMVVGMATMVKTRTRVRTKTKVKGNTTLAQLVRMLDGVMLDKEEG